LGKKEGKSPIETLGVDDRIIFKCIFKNKVIKCGMDSCLLG